MTPRRETKPWHYYAPNVETLTADKVLSPNDPPVQIITCTTAEWDLLLPDPSLPRRDGLGFRLVVTVGSAYGARFRNAADDTTLASVGAGEWCDVDCRLGTYYVTARGGTTDVVLLAAATGTAISVTASGSLPITQAGAETNTLGIPTFIGQRLSIYVDTDTSGARTITASNRINQAGNTVMTLSDVGDFIQLEAITIAGALRWQVVANDGVILS